MIGAFTIAIDGPAAAGKGTIARRLAAHFDCAHLDTGLLYRAVGLQTLSAGNGIIDPGMAEIVAARLTPEHLQGDLRTPTAARAASKVATLPAVRGALLAFQRRFARRPGGAILDGRDIGTVVCPDAEVKFFVTASDAVRARRRFEELSGKGHDTTLAAVAADLAQRDARDAGRDTAPMIAADDAHLLDTTELDIDAAVARAVTHVNERIEQGRD